MDRNLGASQVATSSTDPLAYRDLYQQGRFADGHESRTSPTTTTLSSTDDPNNNGDFILTEFFNDDWRTPQNDSLWQEVSSINNPCPTGFRLPTEAEWDTERDSWSSNDSAGAFLSPLKLVVAGYRINHSNGTIYNAGSTGNYWSSTIFDGSSMNSGGSSHYLSFDSGAGMSVAASAKGFSVRCIKD